jgi:phosphoribosylglycinamide formyltransferase-1
MPVKKKLAIFASGSGTNAEEIFKHFQHHPGIEVVLLLSNKQDAYALVRADKFNIPTRVFNRTQFQDETILSWLNEYGVTHIVLAGFLWLIPNYLIQKYPKRIVNIHPALLPKYGGKGMFGSKVHEVVKASGDTETGITIHLVNEVYDEGKVLFQDTCKIDDDDSPDDIAKKVHQLEHKHFPRVIEAWVMGMK